MDKGKLFVCATPIGNLEDITLRAIRVLREVDLIAAEDTRKTVKILNKYNIKTRMISYNQINEKVKTLNLIKRMIDGAKIALVSSGGMPGLSDPGYLLVNECINKNIPIDVVPGPSAGISALVISGLPTNQYIFFGFLPKRKSKRKKILKNVIYQDKTLVFFESPKRVEKLLNEILQILGDRKCVIARELTKIYQELMRGSVSELLEGLKGREIKGELVILLDGYKQNAYNTNLII